MKKQKIKHLGYYTPAGLVEQMELIIAGGNFITQVIPCGEKGSWIILYHEL